MEAFERWAAAQLGGRRIPLLGREGADIAIDGLWIDCKKRAEVPQSWEAILVAARMFGYRMVIVEDVLVMRLGYFVTRPDIAALHVKSASLTSSYQVAEAHRRILSSGPHSHGRE